MKLLNKNIYDIVFISSAIILILIHIFFIKPKVYIKSENKNTANIIGKELEKNASLMKNISPQEIAYIFGLRQTAPVEKKPEIIKQDTSYLEYKGYVLENNKEFHFFKDKRSGKIIKTSVNEEVDGWKIKSLSKKEIILEKDNLIYNVKRDK